MPTELRSNGVNFPDGTTQTTAMGAHGMWPTKFMSCEDQNTAYRHAFAIFKDGSVRGWGHGGWWRLGLGANDRHSNVAVSPAFPATFPGAAAIHTSNEVHQAVVDVNGQLWTWGVNAYGQCGVGHANPVKVPTNISTIASNSIYGKQVWKIWLPCGAEDVGFMLIHCTDGTVHACGYNGYGQCGNGNTTNQYYTVRCGTLTGVTHISCGRENYTTCTAVANGQLYSWGYNGDYQLGTGNTTSVSTPTLRNANSLAGKTITKAVAGYLTVMALASDGTLHGAGNQNSGSFGVGNTSVYSTFTQINTLVSDFYNSGYDYHVAIVKKTDNKLWMAGSNNYVVAPVTVQTGTDGYGNPIYSTSTPAMTTWTEVKFPAAVNFTSVYPIKFIKGGTGSYNTFLALMNDGSVYAWGYNGNGALGIGDDGIGSVYATGTSTAKQVLIRACADIALWGHGSETSSGFITNDRGLYGCGYGGTWANGWIQEVTHFAPIPIQIAG